MVLSRAGQDYEIVVRDLTANRARNAAAVLQSAGLKAGTPGRSAGLGGKKLGGGGLKNGGFGGILEDFRGFGAVYKGIPL